MSNDLLQQKVADAAQYGTKSFKTTPTRNTESKMAQQRNSRNSSALNHAQN